LTTTVFPARVTPSCRTRENSEAARRRCAAECRMATGRRSIRRVILLGPGALRCVLPRVALELHLDTLWHQALAADFAPTAEYRTPILRLHTGAEPELLFAGALGGLISAFGHGSGDKKVPPSRRDPHVWLRRAGRLRGSMALSNRKWGSPVLSSQFSVRGCPFAMGKMRGAFGPAPKANCEPRTAKRPKTWHNQSFCVKV